MIQATRRLFDEDPYQFEFHARVIGSSDEEDRFGIVLDQTQFYPESGGQPADTGAIMNLPVLHVFERDHQIVHILEQSIPVHTDVKGKVDADRRFDHMQQHTGQHILSQVFIQIHHAETIGFHLGQEFSTLDLNVSGLEERDIGDVEKRVNEIITQNRAVHVHSATQAELSKYPLRKPPKTEGPVRIVEVEGFDWSGCCGTHVRRTGEIGLLKILRWEKYKGGSRITFLCGNRCLEHYQNTYQIIRQLSRILSTGVMDLPATAEQLQADRKQMSKKIEALQEQVLTNEASVLLDQAIQRGPVRLIVKCFDNRDTKSVQGLARLLVKSNSVVAVLCVQSDPVFVCAARSENVRLDIRPFIEKVRVLVQGNGGGNAGFGQVSGIDGRNLDKVLALGDALYSEEDDS